MKRSSKTADADLVIGIDFDNTIIDYGNLFFETGVSLGVLPDHVGRGKKAIREYLIGIGREDDWTRIQGLVYGDYIRNASVMDGFSRFTRLCSENGWRVFIISHKTRDSIKGVRFNLHTAALNWLEEQRIYGEDIQGVVEGVFFEATRDGKIHRITQFGCDIMIDDLPDVLIHPDLPTNLIKILYDPEGVSMPNPGYVTAGSWNQVCEIIGRYYGFSHR
jgi:hypothetical protein